MNLNINFQHLNIPIFIFVSFKPNLNYHLNLDELDRQVTAIAS